MAASRFSNPKPEYDPVDEAAFRRAVQESFNASTEVLEIRIAGGVLYSEDGNLKFRSRNNTVTTVGPL